MQLIKIMSSLMLSTLIFSNGHAQKPEQNISDEFNHAYKFQEVEKLNLAYYEQGAGDPVLFLHGIPDNSYLWRNVVPKVAKTHRAIALDLAGYGKSEVPTHDDYSIERHYQYVKGFIDRLNLKNVTLVVSDIGSLYGLKYAIKNESNVKGIVFVEAMYMPAKEWYSSLKMMQKMIFGMMKNEKRAYRMIVEKNVMPKMMLKMSVQRKYSDALKEKYTEPYKDNVKRREIMMYGAGPYTLPRKGVSVAKGDFADEMNHIAKGLKRINSNVPFLIIHATPGLIVRKKNIEYAKDHFLNVSFLNVGKGKHFLAEDHPHAIGNKISDWASSVSSQLND